MICGPDMQVLRVLHQDSTRNIFEYIFINLTATLLVTLGDNVQYKQVSKMYTFVLSDTVLKGWIVICV